MTSYLKSTEKEFTIGKTGTIAGIYDRFVNFYSKEGYEFLIGIIIITRHNLPANAVASLNNQQMLTLTLESLLVHYFAYIKPDNRLYNKSLHPGSQSMPYAGGVIYIAVKTCPIDFQLIYIIQHMLHRTKTNTIVRHYSYLTNSSSASHTTS